VRRSYQCRYSQGVQAKAECKGSNGRVGAGRISADEIRRVGSVSADETGNSRERQGREQAGRSQHTCVGSVSADETGNSRERQGREQAGLPLPARNKQILPGLPRIRLHQE
jgi:hypothetical protein